MTASFVWRGVGYFVSGWLWANDGASDGLIVNRDDGKHIRGTKMCPGMIQIGLSRSLEVAACKALEKARARKAKQVSP